MYKGIVFDLDGTLIDSPLCFQSIRQELDIPDGHYILEYLELLPPPVKKEKLQRLQDIEVEAAQKAVPFPGVLHLLEDLNEREIPVGIFTRNCRVAALHVVDNFRMTINMVITRDDAPAKPDPSGLQKFLAQWNLEGENLLFVGDFRFDIECGKRAGVRTALFTNGGDVAEDLEPDYIVHHYSAFWECIRPKKRS